MQAWLLLLNGERTCVAVVKCASRTVTEYASLPLASEAGLKQGI